MRLLLIGFGTVAQGLCELLLEQSEVLRKDFGFACSLVGIADLKRGSIHSPSGIDIPRVMALCRDDRDFDQYPEGGGRKSAPDLIATTDADVMVEVTYTDLQTAQPATDHVRAALQRGMHVVTTNKGPVARYLPTVLELARAAGKQFLYEGTVMAGSPLLSLIRDTLPAAGITEIKGILNGTTNYILSEMETGLSYEKALKQAQDRGYAEAVPDADVLGWDALAKVIILANAVFSGHLGPDDCPCDGITDITPAQIEEASKSHAKYRLIARVWEEGEKVQASVGPELISVTHPLAAITGATNAATISTTSLGDITISGPGAGKTETGFAILSDLLHLHRYHHER